MIYFSESLGGFFHEEIHGAMPEDGISLTVEKHAELMDAQSQGKKITVVDGDVVAIDFVNDETWDASRIKRNRLLSSCDWTQMADCPLSTEAKADWIEYRQSLRDVTDAFAEPGMIAWPTRPE